MLVAGFWLLVAGCLLLVAGCLLMAPGCLILFAQCARHIASHRHSIAFGNSGGAMVLAL